MSENQPTPMPTVDVCWRTTDGTVLVCGGNTCPAGYNQIGNTSTCALIETQTRVTPPILPVTGGHSNDITSVFIFILSVVVIVGLLWKGWKS